MNPRGFVALFSAFLLAPGSSAALSDGASVPSAAAQPRPKSATRHQSIIEIHVTSTRIRLGDIMEGAAPEIQDIDLGPTPAPFGSRVVTRTELRDAIGEGASRYSLPAGIRVVRKMRKLTTGEIDKLTRDAASKEGVLTKGVTIATVKVPRSVDVADGFKDALLVLPKPPRRIGTFQTTGILTLMRDQEQLARITVPVSLSLSEEATAPDVRKGSPITIVVRRGYVEIAATGTANADADIGGILQVTVKNSGRTLRARLIDKDRALSLDGS